MARSQTIKLLRTTRANLNTQKTASGLVIGEPYLITDESRFAVGTAVNNYSDAALKSEVDLKAPINNPTFTGVQTFSAAPVFSAGIPLTELPIGIITENTAEQSQTVVSGTSYYITNSGISMPATFKAGMIVGTKFKWRVWLTKTAAGTGTFQIKIYRGVNGSISDTADVTQSLGTQTAVVDTMLLEVSLYVKATGASGSYFWTICPLHSAATATGFGVATGTTGLFSGTVSSVAMNTANLDFGLGFVVTTGTPTIRIVSVEGYAYRVD